MKYYSRRDDMGNDLLLEWVDADISKMTNSQLYEIACLDCEDCDNDEIEIHIVGIDNNGNETTFAEFCLMNDGRGKFSYA